MPVQFESVIIVCVAQYSDIILYIVNIALVHTWNFLLEFNLDL
jgi:hypothetical protein